MGKIPRSAEEAALRMTSSGEEFYSIQEANHFESVILKPPFFSKGAEGSSCLIRKFYNQKCLPFRRHFYFSKSLNFNYFRDIACTSYRCHKDKDHYVRSFAQLSQVVLLVFP